MKVVESANPGPGHAELEHRLAQLALHVGPPDESLQQTVRQPRTAKMSDIGEEHLAARLLAALLSHLPAALQNLHCSQSCNRNCKKLLMETRQKCPSADSLANTFKLF